MRELCIQIPKEEHSRGKGKSVQRLEGKSMPGMFKWHQGSQYTWREVIEQEIN